MKKIFSIIALFGVLSAFAIGCGDGAKTKTAPTSPSTTPSKSSPSAV